MYLQLVRWKKYFLKIVSVLILSSLHKFCNADYANLTLPIRVAGVFKHETCASAIATYLAVDFFNKVKHEMSEISYQNFTHDDILMRFDDEMVRRLNNSIIITEGSLTCERLTKVLPDMDSFLVCLGIPTRETLSLIENQHNIYLSQPNPEAVVHCLYKLIKLLVGDQKDTPNDSSVSLVYNVDYSYRQVHEEMVRNLYGAKISCDEIPLSSEHHAVLLSTEKIKAFSAKIISAILDEPDAMDLLCHFSYNMYSIQNRTLIFVGLPRRNWLQLEIERQDACERNERNGVIVCNEQELLNAAEGHILLEYPSFVDTRDNEDHDGIRNIKRELRKRLYTHQQEFNVEEAFLAFDSAWKILTAVNRTFNQGSIQIGGKSVEHVLINKSFAGLTGEDFSFIKYRNGYGGCVRSTTKSVIAIYRFENGVYVPIGRHFNTNNSFVWYRHLFSRHTWKPTRAECPNLPNSAQSGVEIPLMSLLSLVLTVLFKCIHIVKYV